MNQTEDVQFKPSCCEGAASTNSNSAQPCGCDPGANYRCALHVSEHVKFSTQCAPLGPINRSRDESFQRAAERYDLQKKELCITDPTTGGQKGQKLQRYDLIPVEFEEALAEVFGRGALKYADRNWEKGYRWSLSVGALRRHLAEFLKGHNLDEETGAHHLAQVAWHACALFIFEQRGLGTDDIRRKV